VVKAKLANHVLVYAAEVDCCSSKEHTSLNDYCELKTCRGESIKDLNLERNPKFSNHLIPMEWLGNHPFEYSNIRVMGKFAGAIFSIHPLVLRNLKIKGHVTICLFDLSIFENFSAKDKTKYKPLSKFPHSSFDWTVVVPVEKQVAEVLNAAKKVKLKELKEVTILDIFPSDNSNFVTFRALLADESATLTSEFLKRAEISLVDATTKAGFNLK
jgi:phenylalanyl-tRNA synthetase beta chain